MMSHITNPPPKQQPPARTFQDLLVWQKAHKLVLGIYILTREFPRDELYGLTSQIRRAAVSVPANIAEGFKRKGQKEKLQFLNYAQSSLEEVRYFLVLSLDLGYGKTQSLQTQLDEVGKMLAAYAKSVASQNTRNRT